MKETELSQKAQQTFWNTFYQGQYEKLPEATSLLTAAYLENPRHPNISLLLAHAHFWKIVERSREANLDPRITDHAILAERYFTEAHRLNPKDHRILGWLGGVKLAMGNIHQDEKLTRTGYFMLQDSIRLYPEFNYFSAGYPHNLEGFAMNMGDMLVKNGEVERAKKAYATARPSKDFSSWKYRSLLEERIAKAEERATLFRGPDPKKYPEMMINSPYACMACHEK